MAPFLMVTAAEVTVKKSAEKEAKPLTVLVASATVTVEEIVGLWGSPVTVILVPGVMV